MKICIFGAGYAGLVSGVCLADFGHQVEIIEKDLKKLEVLRSGLPPFYEPDLERLMSKNNSGLRYRTSIGDLNEYDLLLVYEGTPQEFGEDRASMKQIDAVFDEILASSKAGGFNHNKPVNVFIKSTVPIGTNKRLRDWLAGFESSLIIILGSNPEFLREGCAISDFFKPDRVVLGAHDNRLLELGKKCVAP